MQQQAEGRGGCRAGRDHAVPDRGLRLVDSGDDDTVNPVRRQGAQQYPGSTVVEVVLHNAGFTVLAGGVNYHIDAKDIPGHFRGPVNLQQACAERRVDQEIALQLVPLGLLHLGAEQVVEYFRFADVGHRHHLDVAAAGCKFVNLAAGATETHDAHPYGFALCHMSSPCLMHYLVHCPVPCTRDYPVRVTRGPCTFPAAIIN